MTGKIDAPGKIRFPNFLIIGAAKAGTTSLHNYLSQHPQIYMSPMKEPMFFAYENAPSPNFRGLDENDTTFVRTKVRKRNVKYEFPITKLPDYQKLFAKVQREIAVGESSPVYMYFPRSVERIQHYVPHAKLIAILRNPVDRAYSQYQQFRREGHEPIADFGKALEIEQVRMQRNWSPGWFYKQRGFYYRQLKRYFDRFDKNQIRIYLYDDLCSDPMSMMKDIFRFLGIDDTFIPDLSNKFNVSSGPIYGAKSEMLDAFLNNPSKIKSAIKLMFPRKPLQKLKVAVERKNIGREYIFSVPPMSEDIRRQLQNEYRGDILKLQDLIGQDLSQWLA